MISLVVRLGWATKNVLEKINGTDGVDYQVTSATSSGGAVRANVTPRLAQELWVRSEVRGEAIRLDRSEVSYALEPEPKPKEASRFVSSLAECLDWRVTARYSFRSSSHINLQELRALRREIVKLASNFEAGGQVQLASNDSRVAIGAVAKGRSSSYKVNGLLRAQLPFLVMGNLALALLWIETESNLADHPSRFRELPAPKSPQTWMAKYGVLGRKRLVGIEVFAGSHRIAMAHKEAGIEMFEPVNLCVDALGAQAWVEQLIRGGVLNFIWLAPPRRSFSRLRTDGAGHFLRPPGDPEGDARVPEVRGVGDGLHGLVKPPSRPSIVDIFARLVDRRLEMVVNNAYRDGEKLYWVTLGVLSVQRAVKLSGAYLKSTWSAIRAWRLLQPIQPRIPMTWYVLQCLLVVCLARGNAQRGQVREEWWGAMVAFWLAFIGMLRPGEVDQLRVGDFCFPEMPELAEGVGLVISIRQAKTRRVWAKQFVIVDSRELVEWCRWWTEGKKPKDRFLSLSRRRWAQILVESLEILHLDSCGFTLGSLRGITSKTHWASMRWPKPRQVPEQSFCRRMSKLQAALRELAAALEEVEEEERWEVVSAVGRAAAGVRTQPVSEAASAEAKSASKPYAKQPSAPSSEAPVESGRASGSHVAYHEDWRHYVILANPKKPDLIGYISGPGATTWKRIEKALPTGKLCTSAARLRRVESENQARQVWAEAHGNREMP
ncbi:unnamed protein product, partial [Symbiodinium sp. KB8]